MDDALLKLRNPEPVRARPPGLLHRLGWLLARLVAAFLFLSVALVVIYRFVPVPVTMTMIMDPNGITKSWVPLSQIDRNMVDAAIAGEDGKFCQHNGFDQEAILKAWERNQEGGRIRGGSTISQQTAKNVFLWQGGGYLRKALEAWFTVLIETIWGKRRIMEVYLNVAETGIGTYGVEAGAQRYYRKPAAKLNRVEAARIAAAFPQPKVRAVTGATGSTRRHGNVIAARVNTVRADYDTCVYQ
ncbi:MAG: monofunctional biosynthetic peptidoglycan transglycosylase [Novosphingobium sp.]|jgi:monofunctional biosynthetic peptidoglycan transglycosylase|uniref:monofunctional biosynthetic peptidoglycan transglycosylase n=1 Tax=Novosphingobium sp. TaxID=1874826 RepID=UPI00301631A4